ncbi:MULTISPECIES: spore coat protein [unclassified Bacillus (in: firmicutes)]|uniref:spore coat protein n=1 Tax=unclassified Bacillus (in: firmicutes) TaxID=185979 RepID=UPI000B856612|nr:MULTISPECIES: spore coat protein [unclassified Bacillus (in: firmicutes)]
MGQPNMNMTPPNRMTDQLNHGGHEVFDLHEVLAGMINVLDQFMLFRVFIKDQELLDILDRQYYFILDQYNITCECFTTGTNPSHHTKRYMMRQNNNVAYGMKPSQPKKPNTSIEEIKDQGISGHMLGLIKSTASLLAMTALEVTNPVVRRVMADSVPNYIEMAYEIFLYQNKQQYYQVPQLSYQDMNQMTSSFVPFTGQPQMPNPGQFYKN